MEQLSKSEAIKILNEWLDGFPKDKKPSHDHYFVAEDGNIFLPKNRDAARSHCSQKGLKLARLSHIDFQRERAEEAKKDEKKSTKKTSN